MFSLKFVNNILTRGIIDCGSALVTHGNEIETKESSFPAEMPLIKSIGAANRQSPVIPKKNSGFVPQEQQDWDAFSRTR